MVKLNELQKHELIDWSYEIEEILKNLSEKAQVWRILHIKTHEIFKRKYYCLVIPVTILSSITGAANLALGSIANGNEVIINIVIGAIGIIISVISTLNNIFSFQKRKDEHFRASKDWYRIQRMIDIELSLQKRKRHDVSVFFHLVLQEIERIHEFHPNIREDVIKNFMKKYKNKNLNINIPEILLIKKTLIFKNNDLNFYPTENNNLPKEFLNFDSNKFNVHGVNLQQSSQQQNNKKLSDNIPNFNNSNKLTKQYTLIDINDDSNTKTPDTTIIDNFIIDNDKNNINTPSISFIENDNLNYKIY